MNEKYFWIYGKHSVFAALANPKRKVKKIFVTDLNNINYSNKSIIHLVEPKKISKLFYPQQASHQNIAAEIQKLPSENIENIINDNTQKKLWKIC